MLDLTDKENVRACREVLGGLYERERFSYIRLFLLRKNVRIETIDMSPLLRAGIVSAKGSLVAPRLRVIPMRGAFVVTDYFTPIRHDSVFPVQVDESAYFGRRLDVKDGEIVLDLFSGSGVLSVMCARRAGRIYAVDVNARAVNYSKFNMILNGAEGRVEHHVGDMFSPVAGKKFDLVVANPPYVPTPPIPEIEPLYSNGGENGLRYLLQLLEEVGEHLSDRGRVEIYTGVVGNASSPWVEGAIARSWSSRRVEVRIEILHRRPIRLETLIAKKFAGLKDQGYLVSQKTLRAWRADLERQGFTHFYYLIVSIAPGSGYNLRRSVVKRSVRKNLYMSTGELSSFSVSYVSRLLRDYCD